MKRTSEGTMQTPASPPVVAVIVNKVFTCRKNLNIISIPISYPEYGFLPDKVIGKVCLLGSVLGRWLSGAEIRACK